MNRMIVLALVAAIGATAAPFSAHAGPLGSSFQITPQPSVLNVVDPTEGRLQRRRLNQDRSEYFECAEFSLRVYSACLDQYNGNATETRLCQNDYQGNIGRCQDTFL